MKIGTVTDPYFNVMERALTLQKCAEIRSMIIKAKVLQTRLMDHIYTPSLPKAVDLSQSDKDEIIRTNFHELSWHVVRPFSINNIATGRYMWQKAPKLELLHVDYAALEMRIYEDIVRRAGQTKDDEHEVITFVVHDAAAAGKTKMSRMVYIQGVLLRAIHDHDDEGAEKRLKVKIACRRAIQLASLPHADRCAELASLERIDGAFADQVLEALDVLGTLY